MAVENPVVPVQPVKQTKYPRRLPPVEKPVFRQMYSFYEGLGDSRTIQKVATQFNLSKHYVSMISSAFGWKDRIRKLEAIPKDPVVIETKDKVDEVRRKLVQVVSEVVDTLHELMFISKDIKHGRFDEVRQQRAVQLQQALEIWGFDWKNPKDFKALVATLKDITAFNEVTRNMQPQVVNPQQVNIEKFDLVIKDD